jgi:tRNA 2-thiouridine synthesizing protein A
MSAMADPVILDAKDLKCPLPVLKARKAMNSVPAGGVLRVLATDPGAVADFKHFCDTTGHRLMAQREENGVFVFDIAKQE